MRLWRLYPKALHLRRMLGASQKTMTLVQNKRIRLDYEILEKFEAGIELLGLEVKSVKKKQGSLKGSYITIRINKDIVGVFLVNAHIPPYQPTNTPESYDPYRERRLLLNKKEINTLIGFEKQRGLTIVPISMYNKGRKIKVEIAVVRGKKKYDKREAMKKRDAQRDIDRTLKRQTLG